MKKYMLLLTVLFAGPAWAHFEVLNTADVLPPGQARALAGPQLITGDGSGLNVLGAFEFGYSRDADVRFNVGFGQTDFHFGGSYKWAPIPDFADQPAIGVIFSTFYAHIDGSNEFTLRAAAIVSKKFQSTHGLFTPYASLPIGLSARSGDEEFPIQAVVGTAWKPAGLDRPWSFIAELGVNLEDSFSHITVGWIFDLEGMPSINIRTSDDRQLSN